MKRRDFFGVTTAGVAFSGAERVHGQQEVKKTPEQRVQDLETKIAKLLETLEWLTEAIKSSGVTKESLDQLEEKGGHAVFLGDLQSDLKLFGKMPEMIKGITEASESAKRLKSPKLDSTQESFLASLESEIVETEKLGFIEMRNTRWDAIAIEQKLAATPKTVSLSGFGADVPKVQGALKDIPPALLATFDRIQSGAQTKTEGRDNYYGHQFGYGTKGTARTVLTVDGKNPKLDEELTFEIAKNFNYDEIDGLAAKERVEWYKEAIDLQAKGRLKDDQYERRLQDFYEQRLKPNIGPGGMTEKQAQAVLSKSRLSRFVHIATLRLMNDPKFAESLPEEAAFAKKWMDKAQNLKMKVELK